MNAHLPAERLDRWIAGERDPHDELHVRGCAACRAELQRIETALEQFRQSARAAGENAAPAELSQLLDRSFARSLQRMWRSWPRFAVALAVLSLMIDVPIYFDSRARERSAAAQADALLLEQVYSEISRPVAGPMEPLVGLVSWNKGAADATQTGETQ